MAVHITAIGEARAGRLLRRAGARAGDVVWVTGTPGLAHLGLACLTERHGRERRATSASRQLRAALRAFRCPRARVDEALHLSRHRAIGAAIDVSDGLASDLGHIIAESSRERGRPVGAELDAEALLALPGLARASRALDADPLEAALFGGEAYELCFTTTPAFTAAGARSFRRRFATPLARIGRIFDGSGVFLRRGDGTRVKVSSERGWDHFRE
jgi:thiamine-monophosphate kinase